MPYECDATGRLSSAQIDYFETFGFLVLRRAFPIKEMVHILTEVDDLWSEKLAREPAKAAHSGFVEQRPLLFSLVTDDRIFQPMVQLLGRDFIWNGSEGIFEDNPTVTAHHWHSDRPGPVGSAYRRIKIMLYLEPKTKGEGALRVIPGSHRDPLHTELLPFHAAHAGPDPRFFDLPGHEIPGYPLETAPGDVALFSQSLYHSVYGKREKRRYIALKFAARPTTDAHLASLYRTTKDAFDPHPLFLNSDDPRLIGMVAGMPELAERARDAATGMDPTLIDPNARLKRNVE